MRTLFALVVLCMSAGVFGYPPGSSSASQMLQLSALNNPLPAFAVQAPAAPAAEYIPQPTYTLHTNVLAAMAGEDHVNAQITLPMGQSAQQLIQSTPLLSSQTYHVAAKKMPSLSAPAPITLPEQELTPQLHQYATKSTQERQEAYNAPVTQQVFQPYLQRLIRQAVPIQHVEVSRTVQPIVNREVQPVLEERTEEGPPAPALIASVINHIVFGFLLCALCAFAGSCIAEERCGCDSSGEC